jgi:hypothetical protein
VIVPEMEAWIPEGDWLARSSHDKESAAPEFRHLGPGTK